MQDEVEMNSVPNSAQTSLTAGKDGYGATGSSVRFAADPPSSSAARDAAEAGYVLVPDLPTENGGMTTSLHTSRGTTHNGRSRKDTPGLTPLSRGIPTSTNARSARANTGGGAAAASGAGAGTGAAAAGSSDRPSWQLHLVQETTKVSKAIKKRVAAMHQQVKNSNVRAVCLACEQQKYALDLVAFNCVQRHRGEEHRTKHRFCTDCITKLLKQQEDGQKFINCSESAALWRSVEDACLGKLHIVCCPTCHSPNGLVSTMQFHATFDRDRVDSRLQFTVHLGSTQILQANFTVDRVCENQRRPFFGAFSSENLLVVDFCGRTSTEREYNASEVENLAQTFERPNRSWAWLEDWTPDLALNPRGGWRYARDFTPAWPSGWSTDVAMLMFVRRRVLLRARVRVNEDVIRQLQAYFVAQDEDG